LSQELAKEVATDLADFMRRHVWAVPLGAVKGKLSVYW